MLFAGVGGATVLGINFLTALVTHPGAVQPDRYARYALGLWSRPSQLLWEWDAMQRCALSLSTLESHSTVE